MPLDFGECNFCGEPAANRCSCGKIMCYDCCRLGPWSEDPICPDCKKKEDSKKGSPRMLAVNTLCISNAL